MGEIVLIKRKSTSNGGNTIHWNVVNLPQMKGAHFLIISKKDEIIKHYRELSIVDASGQECYSGGTNLKYFPSGVVVISISKLQNQQNFTG